MFLHEHSKYDPGTIQPPSTLIGPTPTKDYGLIAHQRSPKTPSGMGVGKLAFLEEADAPSSSARAARYSSTHKPQTAFK